MTQRASGRDTNARRTTRLAALGAAVVVLLGVIAVPTVGASAPDDRPTVEVYETTTVDAMPDATPAEVAPDVTPAEVAANEPGEPAGVVDESPSAPEGPAVPESSTPTTSVTVPVTSAPAPVEEPVSPETPAPAADPAATDGPDDATPIPEPTLAPAAPTAGWAPFAVGDPEYLTVRKTVSDPTPEPGEPFTYTIAVSCTEASCLDAQLTDALPPELAGYVVRNITMTPPHTSVPRVVTWTEAGVPVAQPTVVGAATALTVDFTDDVTSPGGTGLQSGTTFNVTISLEVPADLAAGTYAIDNTAATTATNSAPDSSTASITVVVPVVLDVDASKSWTPGSQTFDPGAESRIVVGATNRSNVGVDTLTIQEPATAPDGAETLDADNPFTIVDFVDFESFTMPAGATTVRVDAYVFDPTTGWTWEPGTDAATPVLPAGVDASDVGGLRWTFASAAPQTIEPAAGATVALAVVQRATDRDTADDLSAATRTIDNTVTATVSVAGEDPVTDEAEATYRVTPALLAVDAAKDISPGRISAGETATATISARNHSDVGAAELRLADLDYFTADVTFGGFTTPPTWPAGATDAVVIYHLLAGGTEHVPFDSGMPPADPSAPISGFEIVYTADGGGIDRAAATAATFRIVTTETATEATNPLLTTNGIGATVVAPNRLSAHGVASDDLTVVTPAIEVDLVKNILPASAVRAGEAVVSSLATTLTTSSDYVTATQIVVEDAWDGAAGSFWDAFRLTEIAPTQVPAGATLTVDVQTTVGTWSTLTTHSDATGPSMFEMTATEIAAALAPADIGDVTGIRFTFDHPSGFAAGTRVTPYVVTTANADLRSGGTTTPGPDTPVELVNVATAGGAGATEAGSPLHGDDVDTGSATIESTDGDGEIGIDKDWDRTMVSSQSSERRATRLDWRVGSGYETVTITDPVSPGDGSSTVFQAFDLRSLRSIAPSTTPFTNGWFLRYDTVSAVRLYGAGSWTTVTPPAGGWGANGGFVGYTLSDSEALDTIGVELVLVENGAARAAARLAGPAYDPYAPLPGSGVATSSTNRTFTLEWQIRDRTRIGGQWVTATETYNTADAGVVENTARLHAVPTGGGTPAVDTAADTIVVVDPPPGVTVDKSVVVAEPTHVPSPGTVDPEAYPTATYTLTANNDSVARASYIRVMDPPTCGDSDAITACAGPATAAAATADPFDLALDWLDPANSSANPFDRYDLTDVSVAASIATEIDLDATTVWVLRHDPVTGASSTSPVAASALDAMDATDLADVIGLSVAFQGPDPAVSGGTITAANDLTVTMALRLRTTVRSTGEPQALAAGQTTDVVNRVVAQSYDPVLSEGVVAADVASVDHTLTGGVLNIAARKSISPTSITEPRRHEPVTVTLGADQGTAPRSTLSPAAVHIRDDRLSSPDFWEHFDLTALGAVNAPAGADIVTVAVHGPFGPAGAPAWLDDGPSAIGDAALPAAVSDTGLIDGIRVEFTRADGGFFSPVLPAADWSASVQFVAGVRDTERTTGAPIGFEVAATIENTVVAQSLRPTESTDEATATAPVELTPGTHEIAVRKLTNDGNRFAPIGSVVPFDLEFENTGSAFLTIEELRDTLPPTLLHLGDPAPVTTPDPDGLLPAEVTVAQVGDDVVFTWPEDSRTMAPGETYRIRIWLELQPIGSGERAVNTMTVRTAQTLARCSHLADGDLTGAWDDEPTTCGTTDYVTPATGANLFTVKGVRGSIVGAFVPGNPAMECAPTLSTGAGSFYRTPCVAHSIIGGVDDWALRAMNAGTVPVTEMTLFDQLPVAGDAFLVSGAGRGSAYRPRIVGGSLQVALPAGATHVVEVSSSTGVCVGTWGSLATSAPCEQNGEVWQLADGATDWSRVSGLRITIDFSGAAGGALASGETVDVTYSTRNVESTDTDASGASTVVPATDQFAWNQFGVKYRHEGSAEASKIAPNAVGVHLLTGPISVDKQITGGGAAYAPDAFDIDVECSINETTLDLGAAGVVRLDSTNGHSARIDGIPVGSTCTLDERGDVGTYGESARVGTPVDIDVATAAVDVDVPAGQHATITNDYAMSALTVHKRVTTDADGAVLGPFAFALTCSTSLGVPVRFPGDASELTFTIGRDATWSAPDASIPVGATCTLTETDSGFADAVTITGDDVTDNGDGSATVRVGAEAAEVIVANRFDVTSVEITKVVEGVLPNGPLSFTVALDCTIPRTRGPVPVVIPGGRLRTLSPDRLTATFDDLPTGATCTVSETERGGADETTIEIGGTITPAATVEFDTPSTSGGSVAVRIVNRFEVGVADDSETLDPPAAPGAAGSGGPAGLPTAGGGGGLPTTGGAVVGMLVAALAATLAGLAVLRARRERPATLRQMSD